MTPIVSETAFSEVPVLLAFGDPAINREGSGTI
jgi:hypothetical protein